MKRLRTLWATVWAEHRWSLVALALGLAIRIPLLVHAQRQGVPGDQLQYSAQAMVKADGRWFEQPFFPGVPAAEHPPVLSTLLTPITWLVSHEQMIFSQRLVVLAFGLLNIALMYVLGRRWSQRAAVLCSLLAAVDVHLFLDDVLIFSETIAVTLVILVLLVLTRPPDRRRPRRESIELGVLLGMAVLTRAELALAVPMVWAWQWRCLPDRRRWRTIAHSAVPVVVAMATVAPWVLWNQSRFEESVTLSTNDGLTLLGANCDETYYGDELGGWSFSCALAVEGGPDDDASVVSGLRRDAAISYVRHHLGRTPLVAVARVLRQWELGWVGSQASIADQEGRPPWLQLLGTAQWWALGALGIVGLMRADRRRRWLLLILPVQVTLVAALIEPQWRLRAPAQPAIIVAAALGLLALRERRHASAPTS